MEVILTKDVEKLGEANQIVNVKNGFARNYLIPQGFAVFASEGAKKVRDERLKQTKAQQVKEREQAEKLVEDLKNKVIKVGAKVGKEGKIFGSVTTLQLAEAVKNQTGIEVDRKNITIPEEVKSTGTYTATLKMQDDLEGKISFEVVEE